MKIIKTPEIQKTDSTRDCFIFLLMVVVLCFYSPFCIRVMRDAGGAFVVTAYVWLFPDSLRGRSGSLVLAHCLAAFMWLCAAVVFILSYFGDRLQFEDWLHKIIHTI